MNGFKPKLCNWLHATWMKGWRDAKHDCQGMGWKI